MMISESVTVSEWTREEKADLDAAVKASNGANKNMWLIGEIAERYVGRRDGMTEELARRIKRSSDTIEAYAKGYKLYLKLMERYPSHCEEWREDLYFSHFVPVARKWAAGWISLTDSANYLSMAVKENLSVDELRAKLPSNDKTDPKRMAKRYIKSVTHDYIIAPRLDISRATVRAAKLFVGRLERDVK